MNKKKKSTNTSPYPDEVIDRLARAFYPAILACWNSEEGQREFAAWQAEQAHHAPSKEKQSVPDGERPVVHIAVICGFNRKFYKQSNSQRPVCDMQFTVVANESNRELRWQGASYSGAHPVFFTMLHHFLHAASGIRHQHGSGSDAAHPGIVPIFCAGMPCKLARKQCHFPAYCPILSA